MFTRYNMQNLMKIFSRILFVIILIVLVVLGLIYFDVIKFQDKAINLITLSQTEVSLKKGKTFQLEAEVYPLEISHDQIKWESSNTDVATVNSVTGYVMAKNNGVSTITARIDDNLYAECFVSVGNVDSVIKSIKLNSEKVSLLVNKKHQLKYTFTPKTATMHDVYYQSSDNAIVTVNDKGEITAKKAGKAIVSIFTKNSNASDEILVEVYDKSNNIISNTNNITNNNVTNKPIENYEITGVNIKNKDVKLIVGGTISLEAEVLPKEANQKLNWKSTDTSIVTVNDNGKVSAVGVGEAHVVATSINGKSDLVKIVVGNKTVRVEKIEINNGNIELNEGNKVKLVTVITPSNATNQDVVWTSDNENIAKVSETGLIEGVSEGNTTIRVKTSDGNHADSVNVKVLKVNKVIQETSVSLSEENVSLYVSQTRNITYSILPKNATYQNVTWNSSNDEIVSVVDGMIQAKKVGQATITVKTKNNKTDNLIVNVKPITVNNISLNTNSMTIKVSETNSLVPTITPTNATNRSLEWTSSDTSIAVVNANGIVTGKKTGIAKITVAAKDGSGKKAECNVTVQPNVVLVSKVEISNSSLTLKEKGTANLTVTITPTNATNKSVNWNSSNPSIVSVDSNGKVTGLKVGTAKITATAKDGSGKKAECNVTVQSNAILVTKVEIKSEDMTMIKGDTSRLYVTVLPDNATDKNITWKSSNTSVVSIEKNGSITAKGAGTSTITATSSNKIVDSITITVKDKITTSNELCTYIKNNNFKNVSYEQFRTVINNKDDYYLMKAAHECANTLNLPVVAGENKEYHIYKLNNEDEIPVNTSVDFKNSTIYIHDEKDLVAPTFKIKKDERKNIFKIDGHEYISLYKKIGSLKGKIKSGVKKIAELSGYGNGLIDVRNANKKQYIRVGEQGNIVGSEAQLDFFVVDNNGNVKNDIIWDFDDITTIIFHKIPDNRLEFKNVNIVNIADSKNYSKVSGVEGYLERGIIIARSNVLIDNLTHKVVDSNKNEIKTIGYNYRGIIQMKKVANVEIRNTKLYAVKPFDSTYGIFAWGGVNIKFYNVTMPDSQLNDGRWGITGTNYMKDVVYDKCTLNRIDSHCGTHNLTVKNSIIGEWGVWVIGSGRLLIENTTIKSSHMVSLRPDYGSTWNGNVIIKNCIFEPSYSPVHIINFNITRRKNHDYGYDLYLPNVSIDGLTVKSTNTVLYVYINNKDNTGVSNGNLCNLKSIMGIKYNLPTSIVASNVRNKNGKGMNVKNYLNNFGPC